MNMFKEVFKYRDLLSMLVLRDIRIRYKQAVMGFLWAVFMPMMAVLAGILVKSAMAIVSGKPFDFHGVATVSVKVLPWTFFISGIKFSVNSLVGNRDLVTKIYFPREVFPFASIIACLFDFAIASVTLAVFLAFIGVGISSYLIFLPVLILFLVLFTSGLGLLLGAANVFFRDIKYIVEIILMFGIFFTPVFYEASTFGKYKNFMLVNPVGSILESINSVVVLHTLPDIFWFFYAGITSVCMFVIGLFFFNKMEPLFAENI